MSAALARALLANRESKKRSPLSLVRTCDVAAHRMHQPKS
jgi:hypothetical protein